MRGAEIDDGWRVEENWRKEEKIQNNSEETIEKRRWDRRGSGSGCCFEALDFSLIFLFFSFFLSFVPSRCMPDGHRNHRTLLVQSDFSHPAGTLSAPPLPRLPP